MEVPKVLGELQSIPMADAARDTAISLSHMFFDQILAASGFDKAFGGSGASGTDFTYIVRDAVAEQMAHAGHPLTEQLYQQITKMTESST